MEFVHYNRNLKQRARDLRKNGTLSEALLWQQLKGRQILGYKFTRQKPIDNYIVDFYCPSIKLAIEIDGHSHDQKIDQDIWRQNQLEILGIKFLRFTDEDVKKNMNAVLMKIKDELGGRAESGIE